MSGAENTRRWRAKHPERARASARNAARKYRATPGGKTRERAREDAARYGPGGFATLWEAQGGKCYLCGIYLVPEKAFMDHDHRCCPKDQCCPGCRRGLACDYCNLLIGFALDDPATLRLVADNLEAKLAEIELRLAARGLS